MVYLTNTFGALYMNLVGCPFIITQIHVYNSNTFWKYLLWQFNRKFGYVTAFFTDLMLYELWTFDYASDPLTR